METDNLTLDEFNELLNARKAQHLDLKLVKRVARELLEARVRINELEQQLRDPSIEVLRMNKLCA